MKIWVCVEYLEPLSWAVREGRKWHVVKKVVSHITLITKGQKRQPKAYLFGYGKVRVKNRIAFITPDQVTP